MKVLTVSSCVLLAAVLSFFVPGCLSPQPPPVELSCVVGDGVGGVIVPLSEEGDMYLQRVGPNGKLLWKNNLVAEGSSWSRTTPPVHISNLASDGVGGAFVVQFTSSDADGERKACLQRIDGGGQPLWEGGRLFCASGLGRLASDGLGGVIFAWAGGVRRLNAAGEPAWGSGGVSTPVAGLWLIGDGKGGAALVRDTVNSIAVQYVSGTGNLAWPQDVVVPVAEPTGTSQRGRYRWFAGAACDGQGGVVVVWKEDIAYVHSLYVQRVDSKGALSWPTNVLIIRGEEHDNLYAIGVLSAGSGGAIVAWEAHYGSTNGVWAQRVDGDGQLVWAQNGIPLAPRWKVGGTTMGSTGDVVSDGAGGAIVTWAQGPAFPMNCETRAQRIGPDGKLLWGEDGVSVFGGILASQHYSQVVSDGAGGAVVVCPAGRGRIDRIYAQRLDSQGRRLWGNGVPVTP